MTAYFIAQITIRDPDRYSQYAAGFMPILTQYGGRLLVADDQARAVEGVWDGTRIVVLAFEDTDAAERWRLSPEYQAIAVHRWAASDAQVVLAQGRPPR